MKPQIVPLDRFERQYTMFTLKRHCSPVESLPHDVVELILERLPVKPLGRFKSVSKKWKSTIESPSLKQGQLICRRQSRGPDVLFVRLYNPFDVAGDAHRFEFGSSIAYTVSLPSSGSAFCPGSCDGLVSLYNTYAPSIPNVVVNPTTGWHQSFPLSAIQQFLVGLQKKKRVAGVPAPELGFGKDMIKGTYKAVWLYNSSGFGLDSVTTCEVFDFSSNAWRFIVPASSYRVIAYHNPVHFNGSLCWLTECEETKVLSLDLHTETFQIISKAPFPHAPDHCSVTICILDNRLCVSQRNWSTQVIWSLDSSSSTWKEMCSLDLTKTLSWFDLQPKFVLSPIAIVDKNKLLIQGRDGTDPVVIHDLDTKSCDLLFIPIDPIGSVYYFESLLSVL